MNYRDFQSNAFHLKVDKTNYPWFVHTFKKRTISLWTWTNRLLDWKLAHINIGKSEWWGACFQLLRSTTVLNTTYDFTDSKSILWPACSLASVPIFTYLKLECRTQVSASVKDMYLQKEDKLIFKAELKY